MTLHSTCDAAMTTVPAERHRGISTPEVVEGWDALAVAELGRRLTPAERDLTCTLPAEDVLDRLFPPLCDAARHEVLWALG